MLLQREKVFVYLWANRNRFTPAWEFVGYKYVNELMFMSYKCPTRLSELYKELYPNIERLKVITEDKISYYAYKYVGDYESMPDKYKKLVKQDNELQEV